MKNDAPRPDAWKQSFLDRLEQVRCRWARQFDQALQAAVVPAFDELAEFLRDHGFRTAVPLREEDRRSFKFELTENAYLLMIFRSAGLDSFELRSESFAPGSEPALSRITARVSDLNHAWARQRFQNALDAFVDQLAGQCPQPLEELAPL